jgi:large subunit ribosomal protein L3
MTHVYDEKGTLEPVTLIEVGPCHVLQVKETKSDGYNAIQMGYGQKRVSLANKPEMGHYKKAGLQAPVRFVREIRMNDVSTYKPGQKVEADIFQAGDFVDVTGRSIGKGFQGGVKRWGWAGGPAGHGSMFHRAPGSIQSGPRLSRVTKGHHLPGHMGCDTITVQNLEVMKVDKENNLIVVRGHVPGHKNGYLIVREARKRPKGFKKVKVQAVQPKKAAKGAPRAAPKAK